MACAMAFCLNFASGKIQMGYIFIEFPVAEVSEEGWTRRLIQNLFPRILNHPKRMKGQDLSLAEVQGKLQQPT